MFSKQMLFYLQGFRGSVYRYRGGIKISPFFFRSRRVRKPHEELLGVLIKNGKSLLARRLLSHFILKLYKKRFLRRPSIKRFDFFWRTRILKILQPLFGVFMVRSGPTRLPVPRPIFKRRRYYYANRWFFDAVRKRKEKGFVNKMVGEVVDIIKRPKKSRSVYTVRRWHQAGLFNVSLIRKPWLPLPRIYRRRFRKRRVAMMIGGYVRQLH